MFEVSMHNRLVSPDKRVAVYLGMCLCIYVYMYICIYVYFGVRTCAIHAEHLFSGDAHHSVGSTSRSDLYMAIWLGLSAPGGKGWVPFKAFGPQRRA